MHVGLELRPDFCRCGGGGVAILPPVGFPNLTRRDPDLGQGSFCHFGSSVSVLIWTIFVLHFHGGGPHADSHLGPLPSAPVRWEE